MLVWLQTIQLFLKPFAIKINSKGGVTFMDQYTKTLLTIITVCVVVHSSGDDQDELVRTTELDYILENFGG